MKLIEVSQSGEVVAMTEEMRAESLAFGCEPTCHFCDAPLAVGTEFGFRRVRESVFMPDGGVVGGLRAMGCAKCVRDATPEQIAHALSHEHRHATRRTPRREPGCLITDEGEFR